MSLSTDINTRAFFALLRAGLWEQDARLPECDHVDFTKVYRLATEQTVVGLIAAGLEHTTDTHPAQNQTLAIVGETLRLEQRNKAMNLFIEKLVGTFDNNGIQSVLVKGQGIAQCYERPLWRACGDVDWLLNEKNYVKAKKLLIPKASSIEEEVAIEKHIGMTLDSWIVELHGSLQTCVLPRMDKVISEVQSEIFDNLQVRKWDSNGITIILPEANNDIMLIFTHILKHFFKGGIGLRQICDWCRLLWTFKDSLDYKLLEARLKRAGLLTEWKAFAALAVGWLDYPKDSMPLYNSNKKWNKKAEKILTIIIETGNLGHNRNMGSFHNQGFFSRKLASLRQHVRDSIRHMFIFPLDTIRATWSNFKYSINWMINVERVVSLRRPASQ